MGNNMVLRLGGKVRVRVGKNWLGSIIESVADESTFYISRLLSLRMTIPLAKGKTYPVHVQDEKGIFEFEALVLETNYTGLNENLPLNKLLVVSEPRFIQRRNTFRAPVMVDVAVRPGDDGTSGEAVPEYRTKTLDLSEGGMLLLGDRDYPRGTILNCDIMLNRFGMGETLRGIRAQVVRTKTPAIDATMYQVGVQFIELSRQDRRTLVKFIMLSQRETRKRQSGMWD